MSKILNIREQSRRDYRSVEQRNITISSHAAGMRPAYNNQGCIPTECLVLRENAIFYRAIFPNGNGEARDCPFGERVINRIANDSTGSRRELTYLSSSLRLLYNRNIPHHLPASQANLLDAASFVAPSTSKVPSFAMMAKH